MKKHKTVPRTPRAAKRQSGGMSQAEFGRHIDVSQQRVQQMVASGTITAMANGRIDPDMARVAYIRSIRRSPASEEVRRVAAARARSIEIKNDRELGQLIPIEDVEMVHAEIISALCLEFSAVGAGATRDLDLRDVIDKKNSEAIERCKGRLEAFADNARAGRLSAKDEEESGDDEE